MSFFVFKRKNGTRAPRGVGSSADRCRGQEEGGGRCEKQGVCRLTRGMENRRPCFEVGRSNPSFSGKDINACNSKRNLQGCLFLFKRKNGTRGSLLKSIYHIESPQNRTFILRAFLIIPLFHTPFLRCSTPLPYILPVPLPLSAVLSILPANSHMFRQ